MSRVTAAKSCHCKLEKGKLQNFRLMCGLEVNANSGKVPKPNRLFTSSRESRRRLWQRLGTAWTWRWRKLKMIAPWTLRRVLMWSGKYQWLKFCFLSFTWESDLNLTWVLKQASEKPRRNAMKMIRYLKKGRQIQDLKQSRETCWGQWRPTPRFHWGSLSSGWPRRWGSRPALTRWNPTLQSGLCLVWKNITLKTLSKAQRTRGSSSAYQSNWFRSYHKFKNKSWSNFISTKCQLQNLNLYKTSAAKYWPNSSS